MRILWVKEDFLDPLNGGGSIRTLGILRRLATRHEIHYVGFADRTADPPDTRDYCYRSYAVQPPFRGIPSLCHGVPPTLPEDVRFSSEEMRCITEALIARHTFDHIVCDFPHVALSLGYQLPNSVLFQHNVECVIWERMADCAPDPERESVLRRKAKLMFEYEKWLCNSVRHVIASSPVDAAMISKRFGIDRVSWVPTGVDIEHYRRRPSTHSCDLVFTGVMGWAPNIDAVLYFAANILPLIVKRRPDTSFTIVGREPPEEIRRLSDSNARIHVTGTVEDVRPWLWGAKVAIVPLRVGSGTRLKIHESMAALVPVVSTSIGAEGLDVTTSKNILIADDPATFAESCLQLLDQPGYAAHLADAALLYVSEGYSWEAVAGKFEHELEVQKARGLTQRWLEKRS
jgi:glycosyltransferase involved in cell wall biosynthesis